MAIIISQSLPIPSGLANGQIADAGQITPLYNSLNAFNIPTELISFKEYLHDGVGYPLVLGGTVTKDYTVAILAGKTFFFQVSYSVTGNTSTDMAITIRKNGTAVTAAQPLVAATGPFEASTLVWFPSVDAANGGMFGLNSSGLGGVTLFTQNGGYSTADTTSLGFTITGTAGTLTLVNMKVWGQP